MTLIHLLTDEIEREAPNTLKLLQLVPENHFEWRPHEKSMTLKQLATHIAALASRPGLIASTSVYDFANPSNKKLAIHTTADLVKEFQDGTQYSLKAIKALSEETLNQSWSLRRGDLLILEQPKIVAIRSNGLSHLYHHRAQLGVFLRLLNIPIPGMYGASADDKAAIKA